ncbi:MAG: hypothetical protein ACLQVN_17260 [Bryobacteraceae bacterium]
MTDFDRSNPCRAAFLLLACAGLAPAALLPGPAILPDAKVVIGLRVNGVLDGISDLLPPDWRAQATAALSAAPLAGFDPFRDLEEVVISSTGEGAAPPALIWLRGRFPVSELAETAMMTDRGVPLIRAGPKGGAIAFPDPTIALAGDEALVRAALERMANAIPPTGDLAERTAELRAKYDLWGFGTRPEKAALPASAAEAIKPLDGLQFGVSFHDGLEASARLDVHSAEEMGKLKMALQLLETMLKAQPAARSAQFQVHAEGKTIQIGLTIPRQEWKQALAAQRDTVTKAVLAQIHGPGLPPATMSMLHPKRPAAQAPAAAKVKAFPAYVPPVPQPAVKPATKIVNAEDGGTVIVTLPGHN